MQSGIKSSINPIYDRPIMHTKRSSLLTYVHWLVNELPQNFVQKSDKFIKKKTLVLRKVKQAATLHPYLANKIQKM